MKKCLLVAFSCVLLVTLAAAGCGSAPVMSNPDDGPGSTTTTTTTVAAAITTTTVAEALTGTGGDIDGCTVHQFFYHAIDGPWKKGVGEDKFNAYLAAYEGKVEESNIVNFVQFCGVTREQYIEVMGMSDILDEKAERHHPECPYTYGEFVDAIFGNDPELSERIFAIDIY